MSTASVKNILVTSIDTTLETGVVPTQYIVIIPTVRRQSEVGIQRKIFVDPMVNFCLGVLLYEEDINHNLRNNIIKLQSLIHNQLSSPRYTNLFQYFWYKSGYVENRLGDFENPVNFAFDENTQIKYAYCDQIPIVRC